MDNPSNRVYFNTYIDETGVFHVSPRDGMERLVIKQLLYEIGEHTMEKMVVFDTEVPIKLGSE